MASSQPRFERSHFGRHRSVPAAAVPCYALAMPSPVLTCGNVLQGSIRTGLRASRRPSRRISYRYVIALPTRALRDARY
eukprot:2697380-Rhodomonas_salina.4